MVLARMDVAKDGCSCEPNVGLKVGLVVLEGDCGGKVDVSSSVSKWKREQKMEDVL